MLHPCKKPDLLNHWQICLFGLPTLNNKMTHWPCLFTSHIFLEIRPTDFKFLFGAKFKSQIVWIIVIYLNFIIMFKPIHVLNGRSIIERYYRFTSFLAQKSLSSAKKKRLIKSFQQQYFCWSKNLAMWCFLQFYVL